jgi:hypothetical protein
MKKIALLVFVACLAVPLVGQEKEVTSDIPQAPPAPLSDEWSKWLVGEWEGWSESTYGRGKERLVVEMGLDGQFVLMQATSEMGEMKWSGMAAMTVDLETGEHKGYWVDSWRGMYEGRGKLEGNKETMQWTGPLVKAIRVVEKVSNDKFVVTEKMTMPDGSIMEGKAEMTRVKKSTY